MKFSAQLDVDVVAHETADEVTVLLDVEAPQVERDAERAPATFQVVLDRSGSMGGERLTAAVDALVGLVAMLDARDNFGVVTFDDSARVVVPAGPVSDKAEVVARLRAIRAGGTTDLGAGLVRGLQELRRVTGDGGTLMVVSDGHTNRGVLDPDRLADVVAAARGHRVVTSTLGLGLGYDESLLAGLARAGAGEHAFAADADAAGAAIAAEVEGLLAKSVQAATLTVRFSPAVAVLRLYNDLPAHQIGNGEVMVDVGDLYAGEARRILLRLGVPAMAALGLAQVATLELRYVELPGLVEQTVTVPVTVNVVPGDEAAGRVAHPQVTAEVLFAEAQDDKRRASEALGAGDVDAARSHLGAAADKLDRAGALDGVDDPGIAVESASIGEMVGDLDHRSAACMSKRTQASFHEGSRKRGRRPRPDEG